MIKVDERDKGEAAKMLADISKAKEHLANLTLAAMRAKEVERRHAMKVQEQEAYMQKRMGEIAQRYDAPPEKYPVYDFASGEFRERKMP